jgi:two-component system, NtrC family, nitrogen regulation response regulator GlnG
MTKSRNILLVEDDAAIALVIREALSLEGYSVHVATSLAARDAWLAQARPILLISDVMLPDGNALESLANLPAGTSTIILSAQNTLDTAVRASQQGAFDYLPKPFDLDELIGAVKAATQLIEEDSSAGPALDPDAFPLIGRTPPMQDVYRTIARLAGSELSVLILGESGTGKELVAQAIHSTSPRRSGPFVAVNMAAIPSELIESELFGHEKGAFTGAHSRYAGRFEQARGGTLFLDEIGDMPLAAQTRLLRVLQSGQFTAVGSARDQDANVRIIAATNRDLAALVAEKSFREDLYYRLNVIPLQLPPLRFRSADVGLLARHFLSRYQAGQGKDTAGGMSKHLSTSAIAALEHYDWPGNVRELENIIQRLMLMTREARISARHVAAILPQGQAQSPQVLHHSSLTVTDDLSSLTQAWLAAGGLDSLSENGAYADFLDLVERPLLIAILALHRNNQIKAAAHLGINRNTLRKKLQDHGLLQNIP